MTEDPGEDERQLAAAAQAGDRRAFERLVQLHKATLYRFVRRYVGDKDDAYDLVQDTFISTWLALRRYDARKPFSVWLRAIALNKCRDHGRRRAVRRRILKLFASQSPQAHSALQDREEASLQAKRLHQLDQAIAALPRVYKEPLLLTTVAGLTQQQTAEQLKTSTKAIEMRIRRAKKRLSEALPKSEENELVREG